MRNDIMKFTGAGIFALAVAAAAPASANMAKWDADQNAAVSQKEFNSGFDKAGAYERWDTDGDGKLTREEYNAGVFASYDADGDKSLNAKEYGRYESSGWAKTKATVRGSDSIPSASGEGRTAEEPTTEAN